MSTKITPTHSDYDDIHDAWVTNGRPSQFDREGSFGGAVYRCLDTDAENPDFYEAFSMGPTEYDDDTGRVTKKGWHTVNDDYMQVKVKVKDTMTDRQIRIIPPEYP